MAFTNKVAIVTGGGSGIGRAVAEQLLAAGASVMLAGRREAVLSRFGDGSNERIRYCVTDVTDSASRAALIDETVEMFGRIDILINSAGVAPLMPFAETDDEVLSLTCATNLLAPASLTRLALPALRASSGCVVNVSTVGARFVMPGSAAYAASKAGLDQLTRVLAAELGAHGVRVNAVSPGVTRTDISRDFSESEQGKAMIAQMTPMGRIGEPGEVARVVCWLASEDAGWVTGQILDASGGFGL